MAAEQVAEAVPDPANKAAEEAQDKQDKRAGRAIRELGLRESCEIRVSRLPHPPGSPEGPRGDTIIALAEWKASPSLGILLRGRNRFVKSSLC